MVYQWELIFPQTPEDPTALNPHFHLRDKEFSFLTVRVIGEIKIHMFTEKHLPKFVRLCKINVTYLKY